METLPEEQAAALRERPLLFGVAVDWSPVPFPVLPEQYRKLLADRVRDLGATVTRVDFDWSEIETSPGEFGFTEVDMEVGRAAELGLDVVGRILGSPAWANSAGRGSSRLVPRAGAASDFALFCQRLASRCRGRVDLFEFWREPDGTGWYPEPDAEAYLRWLWQCQAALRTGNPSAAVAVGALGPEAAAFLASLYAAGGKEAFDAVAVDGRPAGKAPDAGMALDEERIEAVRRVMLENGDQAKPLWITQYGWAAEEVGITRQAELMRRTLNFLVAREWIRLGIHDALADPPNARLGLVGLCDANLAPRPAYHAFAEFTMGPGASPPEPKPRLFIRPESGQLIRNGGFEEVDGSGTPWGWDRWGDADTPGHTASETLALLPEPHSGERAAFAVSDDRPMAGGLRQAVAVKEGVSLAAAVWTTIGFTHLPPRVRIGVNPRGDTDPTAKETTWSEWHTTRQSGEGWVEIGLRYPVRAEAESVTVFLEWSEPVGAGRNAVGFDDVRVSPGEP